jgi:hypothetical protein
MLDVASDRKVSGERVISGCESLSDRRDHSRGLTEAHGGGGRYIAARPDDKYVGLLDELRKQGDRLGGDTGMFFLRDRQTLIRSVEGCHCRVNA